MKLRCLCDAENRGCPQHPCASKYGRGTSCPVNMQTLTLKLIERKGLVQKKLNLFYFLKLSKIAEHVITKLLLPLM